MSNDIKWLSDFAENYGKKIKRTAAKKGEQIILDRERLAGAKVGDKVKLNGKMYRIADVDFEDEKGTQDLSITGLERCQPASSL